MRDPIGAAVKSVIVFVLALCLLLCGCARKTPAETPNEDSQATVGGTGEASTEPAQTTSPTADGEETEPQSNTNPQENTTPDDDSPSKDPAPGTESSEATTGSNTKPTGGSTAPTVSTKPTGGTTAPTESTTATTPENKDGTMPSNGIELPDDDWD